MNLENIHSVYFIGIGGIGMSALARWFHHREIPVAGYDRVETPLTKKLVKEGILIHYQDDISSIDDQFKSVNNTLVIYTPAIPSNHTELTFYKENNYQLKKRSEVLGIITEGHYTIAVAGTHGKTTTSSMIAHLLNGSEKGCSAFVGGIMSNYDSNLIIGDENAPVVVEADEFDKSFMRLHPDFTIVTSIDPDHLDIYGDKDTIQQSYFDFINLTNEEGTILLNEDVSFRSKEISLKRYKTYGRDGGLIQAKQISVKEGYFVFDYSGEVEINNIKLQLPGFHNVVNATAAITAALHMGMGADQIRERIESYKGVKRRFEYIVRGDEITYIDDYAHHPSEIEAFLTSAKRLFPDRKLTAIFQPHLFTRTRDFKEGFSKSLSLADSVYLLDIYPARELPIEGVSSDMLMPDIQSDLKMRCSLQDFPHVLNDFEPGVWATIGAGDIDTLVPKIKEYLLKSESIEI